MLVKVDSRFWPRSCVALLDFYHLGSNLFNSLNTLAAAPLSNLQRDYCNILESELMQWFRPSTGSDLLQGRGRCAKYCIMLDRLNSYGYMQQSPHAPAEALSTTAMHVDPSRIALPTNRLLYPSAAADE